MITSNFTILCKWSNVAFKGFLSYWILVDIASREIICCCEEAILYKSSVWPSLCHVWILIWYQILKNVLELASFMCTSILYIMSSKCLIKLKPILNICSLNDAYRFVPEKFEEIFQKHAHTRPDALTKDELDEMLKANSQPNDRAGQ